jgi:ankyrin repeat protein
LTVLLTVSRSNAVSLYKILQRGAIEAERQFEDLSRIGESFDEIKDCNSHIYVIAGKLKTCVLEILSARLQQTSAQAPSDASSKEMQILRMLSSDMLNNGLPVGGCRYRSADTAGPEKEELSVRAIIVIMEIAGEVGAALLLHDERFEQLPEASITVVDELLDESFRLQRKFGGIIQPLLETLRVELPPDDIFAFGWHHHPLVFDSPHWMRLLESPKYWDHQDCLGTTILHFLIEHLGSGNNGISTPVSSENRARFIAKTATLDFSNYVMRDNYNRTLLHVAAQWNVVDVATILLKSGMNPGWVTSTQRTALHYAASLGHSEMCRVLLYHGADINAETKGGNTPLMVSLLRPDETYKVFLNHPDVDVHIQNRQGDTALHMAIDQGNIAAVDGLLPMIDETINEVNNEGETAVCLAVQLYDHVGAAKVVNTLLQSRFINPSLQDFNGKTPLHYAVLEGNLAVCKLLATRIDGGLYVEAGGKTPAELAERVGNMEICKILEEFEDRAQELYNGLDRRRMER